MAGMTATRKRRGDDIESASAKRAAKAAKNGDRFKRKLKRNQYHSNSEEEEEGEAKKTKKTAVKPGKKADNKKKKAKEVEEEDDDDDEDDGFTAVDLLDSDNEALDDDALVDDGASDADDSDNDSINSAPATRERRPASKLRVSDAPAGSDDDLSGDDDNDDDDDDGDEFDLSGGEDDPSKPKSKRNDPNTFATSLQKILGTKLSTTRRVDPVLARSADARDASRRVVDAALEEKARRQMRLERRMALEKGRVKDVLIASNRPLVGNDSTGEGAGEGEDKGEVETTASILATEKRLRKVAQRGVVQLFNAVRAAQVKATQAKKKTHADGVIGMDKREAKVTEMSRKGFLDLIASGGGGLKKGGLEEA